MNEIAGKQCVMYLCFACLVGIGVAGRWGQPEWCFTPTAAAAIFAGCYFARLSLAALVPVAILADERRLAAGLRQPGSDGRDVRRDDAAGGVGQVAPQQPGKLEHGLAVRSLRPAAGDAVLRRDRTSPSGRSRATTRRPGPGWSTATGWRCRSSAGCSPETSSILPCCSAALDWPACP